MVIVPDELSDCMGWWRDIIDLQLTWIDIAVNSMITISLIVKLACETHFRFHDSQTTWICKNVNSFKPCNPLMLVAVIHYMRWYRVIKEKWTHVHYYLLILVDIYTDQYLSNSSYSYGSCKKSFIPCFYSLFCRWI